MTLNFFRRCPVSANLLCGVLLAFAGVALHQSSLVLVSATTCEAVRIPMCRSMPYNMTQIPNLLHHSNQLNALLILEQYQPLVATNCSRVLPFFLCAMFTPVCPVGFSQDVIPPCQDVCVRARRGCEPVLARYNVTWPQELECDDLPPFQTGVCISPEAINSNPPQKGRTLLKRKAKKFEEAKRSHSSSKECPSVTKLLGKKDRTGKPFDFVIRADASRHEALADGRVRLELVVREIFFQSPSTPLTVNQTVSVWSSHRPAGKASGQCGPDFSGLTGSNSSQTSGQTKDVLMMGHERREKRRDGASPTLTCQAECISRPWKMTFHQVIQKWKSRHQKVTPRSKTTTTESLLTRRKSSRKSENQKTQNR